MVLNGSAGEIQVGNVDEGYESNIDEGPFGRMFLEPDGRLEYTIVSLYIDIIDVEKNRSHF